MPYYVQLIKPLRRRKIALLRSSFFQNNVRKAFSNGCKINLPSETEKTFFDVLQAIFRRPFYLVHYDPNRFLHIDVNVFKQWGFGAIIYHVKDFFFPNRTSSQFFFCQCLTNAEIKYWPTKFETAVLVWVIRKIKHMFNAFRNRPQIVIYTDHSVTTFIVKQTKLTTNNTDKFNFCFVRVSIYFFQFELNVKHKPGKLHVIPDALFRLPKNTPLVTPVVTDGIFDVYHIFPIVENEPFPVYHIIFVEMANYLKTQFK